MADPAPIAPEDVAARDDAHLRSLGITPQLNRITRVPGELRARVQLHQRLDRLVRQLRRRHRPRRSGLDLLVVDRRRHRPVARRARVRRAGQPLPGGRVDLPVVEAAVAPDARLVHRLVLLLGPGPDRQRRVAVIVGYVIAGFTGGGQEFLDSPVAARRLEHAHVHRHHDARSSRRSSTRSASACCRILNNIGVATEILGMLVFALVLLFFANNQPVERHHGRSPARRPPRTGTSLATFALGMFMSIFILYGFDTAGTFGEETIDASRQAPRGRPDVGPGIRPRRDHLPARGPAGDPDIPATIDEGLAGGFPIATIITTNLDTELVAGITFGELYLLVILASVFVCTLAIQGAATRMMFSMGRDRQPAARRGVGPGQHDVQDAGQRGDRGRRPRGPADPRDRSVRRVRPVDRRDRAHLPELPAVQHRRARGPAARLAAREGVVQPRTVGHAHQHPGDPLRRRDPHQHRPLGRTRCSATSAPTGRAYWNPPINSFLQLFGTPLDGLPAWPLFETIVGTLLVFGGAVLRVRHPRPGRQGRGGRRDRRGDDRLTIPELHGRRVRRGERSPRRIMSAMTDDILRGSLRDELVAALQRVPELADRELTLTALSGGITNRNFLVSVDRARPSATSSGWPATTRICWASAARSSTRRRSPRPGSASGRRSWPSSAPRATSSPGSSRARRSREAEVREPDDAGARRRLAAPRPRRSAHPRAVRPAPHRRGVSGAGRGAWRFDPGRVRAGRGRRAAHRAGLPGRPGRAAAVPQRPAQRQLHRRRRRASGSSTGSTPGWATRRSTWATSASTTT